MTHRTFRIGSTLVDVFDSKPGAENFAKLNEGDLTVLVRYQTYYMRRGEVELTVNLKGEADQKHGHVMAAAQAVAGEIEALIKRDREAA